MERGTAETMPWRLRGQPPPLKLEACKQPQLSGSQKREMVVWAGEKTTCAHSIWSNGAHLPHPLGT